MNYFIHSTLHPGLYHGFYKKPPFFEGWYFKLVSQAEKVLYAIIPGIILGEQSHAFIQILNGVSGHVTYHSFPVESFWASKENFEVRIGNNRFTAQEISLNIQDDLAQVTGELRFQGGIPWPVSRLSPGIMGWYAWVPRMECYHGVLSFDHVILGSLEVDRVKLDFSGGRGYIEKDWGQSFPEAYVWFQTNHFATNHFATPGTCLTASVAIIPWLSSSFRGFIVGLWHQDRLFKFASYTGARIEKLVIGEHTVEWVIRDRHHRLEMSARQAPGGVLLGPTKAEMGKRVTETLSATVDVRLSRISGEVLFEERGRYAGLEVNGNLARLS